MLHFTFCISYFVLSFYYFVFYFRAKISFWEHLWSPCYLPSGIGEKWSFVLIRANLPTNIPTYKYYIYMLLFIYMQLFTWHVSPMHIICLADIDPPVICICTDWWRVNQLLVCLSQPQGRPSNPLIQEAKHNTHATIVVYDNQESDWTFGSTPHILF